jgi:putative selenium metabolism protein SsnA
MAIVLTNAILVDLDPLGVQSGSLRIDGGRIVERSESVTCDDSDETVDCHGAVVMPGLVNGHTHLYSALAAGMPAPPKQPSNFHEILKYVWWRLDRALDDESNETSALIGALDALRCGTTTLIDHHASPTAIDGSLNRIEAGIDRVGLRAVLCYETTDRHGREGREAGLAENRRYLQKCAKARNHRFAGLVGAHASFTLDNESLDAMAEMAGEFKTGVHIHVAEDPCDEETCKRKCDVSLIDRLTHHNLVRTESVFAHGTHLDDDAVQRISDAGLTLAHNPRSNMNNGVGYTRVARFEGPVMLGTDGIGGDMFTELKHAWFKACDAHAGVAPTFVVEMLAESARRASTSLGITLGKLVEGAAADVVITGYRPATPLTTENLAAHLIFAMGSHHVRHVLTAGAWSLRDHIAIRVDESDCRTKSTNIAQQLWNRMQELPD